MLKKQYRLKKYSAFIATYKNNDTVADKNLCIYFGKEKTTPDITTKYAFVVSKKIHKRAVVRNRIKRLMREIIRKQIKENQYNKINRYISVIFAAKPAAINADYCGINASIAKLLTNKGL
ncbi:MAG: ribonuclease P protein component [Candidatus Avigastranaerophilus sp.]